MVGVELSCMVELARDVGKREHKFKLVIPVCHTDMGKSTFGVGAVNPWNSLPTGVVETNTTVVFWNRIYKAAGTKMFKIVRTNGQYAC